MANQKLLIDIIANDKTKRALGGVQKGLAKVKGAVFNLKNAFLGLGAGLVVRNLVNTGKELENLRTRLKFLLKDTNEGAKAFENMTKFASKVPFSLGQIQSGAGILATVTDNAEDLQNMLEITGNVAAVTGLDFRTASEQIQRSFSAGIGAADLFREKGVRNMLGFKAGATVSIEETVEAFNKVFGKSGRFGKATDELAVTFEGTLSMIGDKILRFKTVLLEAGFFEELKRQFGDLNQFLEDSSTQIDIFAKKIGKGLAISFKGLANTLVFLKENITGVVTILSGLIALKVATFFHGVATSIAGMTVAMNGFNLATKRNIIFGSITVFASAMGFLIHKFKEFKDELNTDLPTFKELNDDIAELEKRLGSSGRKSQAVIEKQLSEKRKLLEILERESGLLDFHNTAHMRKSHLQLGILENTQKELEGRKQIINQFDAEAKLLERLQKAEDERAERLIGSSRNIFDEQQKLAELLKPKDEKGAFEGFKEGLSSAFDVSIFDRFKEAGEKSIKSLNNTLTDFVMTGKINFQNLKETIVRSLVEAMIGSAVQGAINKGTALLKASSIKEALIDVYGAALRAFKNFGGFPLGLVAATATIGAGMKLVNKIKGFQSGGAVSKGQPIMVGEQGAEMFVPNQTGQITQSARGTDENASTNINFNINATDVRGIKELLIDNRATIVNAVNSALNEKGKEALI